MPAPPLRLLPLGVGEAFTRLHYTFGLAVEYDGRWLLIDCPHPIRKMIHEAGQAAGLPFDLRDVDAVLITHLHADHVSGLEDLAFFNHFVLGRHARVVIHPELIGPLWDNLLAGGMGQMRSQGDDPFETISRERYFETIPLKPGQPLTLGPFEVESHPTVHSLPCQGYRIGAGGRTLAISGDTAFDPGLLTWLERDAHLIVHEATTHEPPGMHTRIGELAALPRDLRERLRVIHYPDDYDLEASPIRPLRQGVVEWV